jgi:predicted enzyme related to lactoylglutathione lyase
MVEAPARPAGTVVWVDLSTPDLDGAIHFYEHLLGWRFEETTGTGGTYVIARVADGQVGGLMGQTPQDAGRPPTWAVVLGTDHLDAAVAEVRELGGTVLQPPMSIPGGARIAVVADPAGAGFALMEATGAASGIAWGRPGAPCWAECLSRDPASSRGFLEGLLGWKGDEGPGGYVAFSRDGEVVAGLLPMPDEIPAEVPSYWMAYFSTSDVDDACARAVELGGTVLLPTRTIDEGRFAVIADPAGAAFGLFDMAATTAVGHVDEP